MLIGQLIFVIWFSSVLLAQTWERPSGTANQNVPPVAVATAQAAGQQSATRPSDDLAQMRVDLDRMESLNLNMSSEIEFLRDQNLQILLRTNSQMWTLLIHDLRQRIERDEQLRSAPPQSPGSRNPESPKSPR